MKFKNESGITLVALVITIVILLILAGITINQLTGENGLFARAKQAKQNTIDAQEKENSILEDYLAQINEETGINILANKVNSGEINIGDYIKYTPDSINETDITDLLTELGTYSGNTDSTKNTTSTLTQETDLNWRVLDVVEENGDKNVRLISDRPTTSTITLCGYNGYNNLVYLRDNICSTLYNNSKYAEKTQNLKIEDIQNKMNEKNYANIDSNYGNIFTLANKYYPNIFLQEKGQKVTISESTTTEAKLGVSQQMELINQTTKPQADLLEVRYEYWYKHMSVSDFFDSKYYELFLGKESNYFKYHLSSRGVNAGSTFIAFGMRTVGSGNVAGATLYDSFGQETSLTGGLFPVITLKSNVQIDIENSGNGSTADQAYAIK